MHFHQPSAKQRVLREASGRRGEVFNWQDWGAFLVTSSPWLGPAWYTVQAEHVQPNVWDFVVYTHPQSPLSHSGGHKYASLQASSGQGGILCVVYSLWNEVRLVAVMSSNPDLTEHDIRIRTSTIARNRLAIDARDLFAWFPPLSSYSALLSSTLCRCTE